MQNYRKKQMSKSSVSIQFIPYLKLVHLYPAHLQKDWWSPIYAFFQPEVEINYVGGCRVHDFSCGAKHCKGKGKNPRLVRRYLDTGDKKSTSGLRRHASI